MSSTDTAQRDYSVEPFVHPYKLDDTLYDIGYMNHGVIDVRSRFRRDFPRKVVGSHANLLLNKGVIEGFDCFYSGVRCWLPNFNCVGYRYETSFALSKDHAVPIRVAAELNVQSTQLVMCSAYLNNKLGHIPLAMKLWIRSQLAHVEYDRRSRSDETLSILRKALIDISEHFNSGDGLYLFQPWTYPAGDTLAKEALLFYNKLLVADREFMQMHNPREAYQWLRTYDSSWIDSARLR